MARCVPLRVLMNKSTVAQPRLSSKFTDDLDLARRAAAGEPEARRHLAIEIDSVIRRKVDTLCKAHCGRNRKEFRCTIDTTWGLNRSDASLCEWGNASYGWMMEQLCSPQRLARFEGRGGATLIGYLSHIARSHMLSERWKDWRWQRRIVVPDYILALDADAKRVYWWLCDGDSAPNIAQRLGRVESEIVALVKRIGLECNKRGYYYRFSRGEADTLPVDSEPFSEDDDAVSEFDVPIYVDFESEWLRDRVRAALPLLEWRQQFILEAMVIDGLSAKAVVAALQEQGICLRDGLDPGKLTIQQVYAFCRQAIDRLSELCDFSTAGA